MNKELIITTGIELVLFLIASYYIFYQSYLKALGREIAKLSTIEELTKLTEVVKKEFNEKIEQYKNKLSEELSLKIEPIKAELAKSNITHQIQFGFLHQERAKVLLMLYQKLLELHSAMADWTRGMHLIVTDGEVEEQERTQRVNSALIDFGNFYLLNKIFFSKPFCALIDTILTEYRDKGGDYGYRKGRIEQGHIPPEYLKKFNEDMQKIREEIKVKLPEKIEEIEQEFRKMLNVEDD